MKIIVVTNNKQVAATFGKLDRSRAHEVVVFPSSAVAKAQKTFLAESDTFIYFDVDGSDHSAIVRRVRNLSYQRPYRFGIIDLSGTCTDISHLFHLSAADYVGKAVLKNKLTLARFKRVLDYEPTPVDFPEEMAPPKKQEWTPSGSDWSGVRPDREYTFLMAYAGIDQASDIRKKTSESSLRTLRHLFQTVLERHFAPYCGRVWMWKEDDGLLLLPFDGESVDGVIPALRLALNHVVIRCEEFGAFGSISWRLALHIGNTIYRDTGSTGGIVSEDVNFAFHLGERYLDPGDVAMTGACYGLLPSTARRYFEHRGKFESVEVHTLRPLS